MSSVRVWCVNQYFPFLFVTDISFGRLCGSVFEVDKINAKLREAQRELLWLKRRHHLFEGMPKDYAADTLNADWNKV